MSPRTETRRSGKGSTRPGNQYKNLCKIWYQTRACPEPLYQQIWYTGSARSRISPRTYLTNLELTVSDQGLSRTITPTALVKAVPEQNLSRTTISIDLVQAVSDQIISPKT
jgi:hypothetical protein